MEGDWSNAAFWLCAGSLRSKRRHRDEAQSRVHSKGDKSVLKSLECFGARVECGQRQRRRFKRTSEGTNIDRLGYTRPRARFSSRCVRIRRNNNDL